MIRGFGTAILALALALVLVHGEGVSSSPAPLTDLTPGLTGSGLAPSVPTDNGTAVGNFSHALERIVALVAAAGSAILAIAWARVALSWFSNDVTKKIQAKDRARDALVGTVVLAAALSGLVWGLAQWILTGA
ncbi:MAG: hypothetical protein L3J93_05575 [Thermoplasmata archaeon]|nr:hypothetical protein [Thermoplasmata archaeon]